MLLIKTQTTALFFVLFCFVFFFFFFFYFQAEIWRPPTRPGSSVDMKVSADDFFKLKSLLNNYGIGFKVQITDIQSLINRQNDESNRSLSWHKSYHTLKEVIFSAFFSGCRCCWGGGGGVRRSEETNLQRGITSIVV